MTHDPRTAVSAALIANVVSGPGSSSAGPLPPRTDIQNDWRFCAKCNGLFWAGGVAQTGTCPAGGKHDRGGGSDYSLPMLP
jgi:hypothetical protein